MPGTTGSGVSSLVTDRSAAVPTVVVAVPLWLPALGSEVVDEAVAVLLITLPAASDASTAVVRVNTALPTANAGLEQVTVPPVPIVGVVQLQPASAGSDTNVVPAGNVSLSETVEAESGPLLVAVMV